MPLRKVLDYGTSQLFAASNVLATGGGLRGCTLRRAWPLRIARSLACGAALLVAMPALHADASISRENQIKAVFLFNFPQFVDWPPSAFADSRAPLVIGVLGDDPFGEFLRAMVRGESVNARPLVIRHFRSVDEVGVCHVLFIAESESDRLKAILQRLKGRAILTVGDQPRFLRDGGMIRFDRRDNRMRLRIDDVAAKAADLTLSSKLLRRAELVAPGEDEP